MIRGASFRDPGGSVSVTHDRVIRTVFPLGLPNLNACLNSAAARQMVESGSLIATHHIGEISGDSGITVEHPRIPFIAYPHEWAPIMLHAAGRLTLELCSAFLDEGLGLKDATPLNVLFRGPRPIFIDVLSIEEREPSDPIWLADAQFTRTFLIPLLLNRRAGYPIHELFLFHRDGLAPVDAVRRLPGPRRWLPPDLGLVTLPARAANFENESLYRARRTRDAGEARFILSHRFGALRKKLDALEPLTAGKGGDASSGDDDTAAKTFVEKALTELKPARVLDIGSGSGEFSLIAAAAGASVIAIDDDPDAVSALWRAASAKNADILPLVVNFARPTPGAGWCCEESAGFLERAEGFFDCALLIGGIHRLMVTDQIPLTQIFDVLASLATGWLIVEYIGPGDPAFHRLARGRDALYGWYNRIAFDEAACQLFDVVESADLPSGRAICLLRRKS